MKEEVCEIPLRCRTQIPAKWPRVGISIGSLTGVTVVKCSVVYDSLGFNRSVNTTFI